MNEEELKKEIEEQFKKLVSKSINRHYITAGDFIRFRDKCILAGQLAEREKCLKMIEEYYKNRIKRLRELGFITVSEELEQDCKELTQKIKEGERK